MAWRAWREADDFMDAAEQVDNAVDGHQEIVTLASLADPAAEPPAQREQRTPLFPLLWRRAAGYLERFDPNGAFAFEVRRPLVRSLPIAAAMVVLLAAVALALVRPPSAEQVAGAQTPRRRPAAGKLALIRRQGPCRQNTRRRRRAGKSRAAAAGEAGAIGRSDERAAKARTTGIVTATVGQKHVRQRQRQEQFRERRGTR